MTATTTTDAQAMYDELCADWRAMAGTGPEPIEAAVLQIVAGLIALGHVEAEMDYITTGADAALCGVISRGVTYRAEVN